MDDQDDRERNRVALYAKALEALGELRQASELTEKNEAAQVARFAMMALVGTREIINEPGTLKPIIDPETGKPKRGAPICDPKKLHRMWVLMNDGNPRADNDDAIGVRECAGILAHIAQQAGAYPDLRWVGLVARPALAEIDPAFASITDDDLLALVDRVRRKEAMSGVVRDLLIKTRALGASPKEDRKRVQQRVDRVLKSRPRPKTR